MSRRPHVWKPWHAAPALADKAVVLTPEELAELEASRAERRKHIQKRGNAAFRARRRAKREAERKFTQEKGREAVARVEGSADGQSNSPSA